MTTVRRRSEPRREKGRQLIGVKFGMFLMSTFMEFRLSPSSSTVFGLYSDLEVSRRTLFRIWLQSSYVQTNRGGKRGERNKKKTNKKKGSEKRQTLNMQTVKKNKLVANWNVWSESGYVYILKLWKSFPRKYFTKVQTDLSVIK